jgi:hypothetical protein
MTSPLSVVLQLRDVKKIETELFSLMEEQISDRVKGVRPNYERAKRIDNLQDEYAKFLLK